MFKSNLNNNAWRRVCVCVCVCEREREREREREIEDRIWRRDVDSELSLFV